MRTLRKDSRTTLPNVVVLKKALVLITFFVGFFSLNAYADEATDLLTAAETGNTSVVESLINKGVDVNIANKDGATALYMGSQEGHAEVVKLLHFSPPFRGLLH